MASDMSLLQNDDPNNDDMSFWEVRKLEFRVLILGRANAGKTTILERLTDSSVSDSEVRRDGRVLKENSIHGQSERGMHNVTDEIRFISKPGFVFHDSRGFEAGSGDELSRVRDFVDRRSKNVTKLRDQLHAIWFCLPLDEDRELFDSEKEPFYWGRGITPMIIIFTKKDGAIAKVSSNIKETLVRPEGISDRAYNREIRMRAVQAVEDRVTERMNYMKEWEDMHSSALEFMAIGDMNKLSKASSAACGTLIEKTQNSLTGARVKSLLSVVWVKNMIDKAFWCYHWMLVSHNSLKIDLDSEAPNTMKIVSYLLAFMVPDFDAGYRCGADYDANYDDNDYDYSVDYHYYINHIDTLAKALIDQFGPLFGYYSPALDATKSMELSLLTMLVIVKAGSAALPSTGSWTTTVQQIAHDTFPTFERIVAKNVHPVAMIVEEIQSRKFFQKWKFDEQDASRFASKLVACIQDNY